MIRRRHATARVTSPTERFYRDVAVRDRPSLVTVLEHLAAARAELDRIIAADQDDTLDLRIYHGAQLLDDAAVLLGGEP